MPFNQFGNPFGMGFNGGAFGRRKKPNPQGRRLVWSDEFNLPDGSAPNPSNWMHELGNFRNQELQTYTSSIANSFIRNGKLVLKAIKDGGGNWTSASLTTNNKMEIGLGRLEARMKLPNYKGVWPAFWMLGQNYNWDYGASNTQLGIPWLDSREIDVFEKWGIGNTIGSGVFFKATENATSLTNNYANSAEFDCTQFHIYACERDGSTVKFYLDDALVYSWNVVDSGINNAMFILLNFAVGGTGGGVPDGTTPSEMEVEIDYVRYYTVENVAITPVSSITVNNSNLNGTVGDKVTLTATLLPAAAQDKTIVWASSNSAVATVHGGVVRYIASGNATITATTKNGIVASCSVTVNSATIPCTGISLNNSTLAFDSTSTQTLTATKTPSNTTDSVTWSSSNTAVATVNNGVVTPVANGTCTITVTCGSYSATCSVTVSISGVVTVFSDTFTRANSNTTLGTAETGQTWTPFLSVWGIVDGKAKAISATNLGTDGATVLFDAGLVNMELSADLIFNTYAGINFRRADAYNHYRVRISSTGLGLFKLVSSVATALTTAYSFTPVVGATYNVKIVVNGTNIKVYLDGILRLEATDSTYTTQTISALYSNSLAPSYDNVVVKTI